MKTAVVIQHKSIPLEIKEISEAGTFTGYAAIFSNVDLGGDIIAPGAFTKTIKEKQNHPILWGHMSREVIGINKQYTEDAKGLFVTGQLTLEVQRAKEAYALMKDGAVTGLSIGYDTVVEEFDYDSEVRTLKEIKLWEYSLTAFPMNPEAQVSGVKSFVQLERHLKAISDYFKSHSGEFSPKDRLILDSLDQEFSALRASQPVAATQETSTPDLIHADAKCNSILDLIKE